ncbi:hypothetical protein [Marinobacter salicampi]|uniref:hypothetical protein n=1 Tax=Marinobacter salicampi TaxID=435907 RepID=UPI001409BED7|nr:hypothetical protein [Marinobacter salicampi]
MVELSIQLILEFLWLGMYIVAPGIFLYVANEAWYRGFRRHTRRIELSTGLVGVPIHELSHAIVARLFGMKVIELALYRPDPQSRTLGYVNYSYQQGHAWHSIGRFFVGIAPLIGGSLAVLTLFHLTGLPKLTQYVSRPDFGVFVGFAGWLRDLATAIDSPEQIGAIVLSIMIGTHASPSRSDMKGAAAGLVSVLVLYVVYRLATLALPVVFDRYIDPYFDLHASAMDLAALIAQMAAVGAIASLVLATLSFAIGLKRKPFVSEEAPSG